MKRTAPPGFDFAWTLGFLAARTVSSLETVGDGEYRRSLRIGGRPVTLAFRFRPGRNGGGSLEVRSAPELPSAELRRIVDRMLDLDADVEAFHALAKRDPLLKGLVAARPWLRLPQYLDPFEGTLRAILGQQVSLAAASTMIDRLVRRVGEPAPDLPEPGGSSFLVFPTPEAVAALGPEGLGALGLTRAKSKAVHGVAVAARDGRLDWERLRRAPAEEAEADLDALPGIGPWTASYIRMRTLGDRDAFPAADLGVIKALRALLPEPPTPRQTLEIAERWRPWRGYATLHLWHSLG